MSRLMIVTGILLIAAGLLWPWISQLGLGRLPGDIVIRHGNLRIYLPIATSLLLSVVFSVILWWLGR
jgi:hypothetical protein